MGRTIEIAATNGGRKRRSAALILPDYCGRIAVLEFDAFPAAREIIKIDGLRVEYADGFGLARSSNTTPVVVLRFEADNAAALKRIQEDFRRVLLQAAPAAKLPF